MSKVFRVYALKLTVAYHFESMSDACFHGCINPDYLTALQLLSVTSPQQLVSEH